MENQTKNNYTPLYVLIIVAIAMLGFNQYQLMATGNSIDSQISANIIAREQTEQKAVQQAQAQANQIKAQEIAAQILPKGVPEIYGAELKVTFDKVEDGLNILGALDADLNPKQGGIFFANLTDNQKQRYLKIGFMIACEYCCGATSLITKDGQPACGCAHSAAMRGLAKYLLTKHENQYTDEQILDQLAKWKSLFFPQQTVQKYMQANGLGGAQGLPNMVGGC